MLQPKVGDTVIFRAIVKEIDSSYSYPILKVVFIDCDQPGLFSRAINVNRVHAVLPRTEPEIGETVWYDAKEGMYSACPYGGQTLIHIHYDPEDHGKRKWGVVAFKGDIPKSVYFSDLRLTR